MIHVEKTSMLGKVLLQTADEKIITYYKGQLNIYNNCQLERFFNLPMHFLKKIACKIRVIERAMHTDVRWAVELSKDIILILYQEKIYRVNFCTNTIVEEFSDFRGHPFSVTQVDETVFMGDYGGNSKRERVNIYARENETWRVKYSFPKGTIRHIHHLVPVVDQKCMYILTGDENNESGIWKADFEFKEIKPVLIGSQQYRCCQMLIDRDGSLWYATDAPSEQNWIYRYNEGSIERQYKIPGTAIYGATYKKMLLFSTTVEPEAHAKNKLQYWLTNVPGTGIKDEKTHAFCLNDGKLEEIVSFYHDKKPLRLFQYATVHFSNVVDGVCYFTPVCVKKYDNTVFRMSVEDK